MLREWSWCTEECLYATIINYFIENFLTTLPMTRIFMHGTSCQEVAALSDRKGDNDPHRPPAIRVLIGLE